MKQGVHLSVGDVLLMGSILLLALFLFALPFFGGKGAYAQIVLAETGETQTIDLSRDALYEVTARGIHLTVQVDGGCVFVKSSDCRDGICRNTPKISRAGQSIVCAPAGVVVRITAEEAVVDGVSG